jgi:MYXO-CTERM domain-containing protein
MLLLLLLLLLLLGQERVRPHVAASSQRNLLRSPCLPHIFLIAVALNVAVVLSGSSAAGPPTLPLLLLLLLLALLLALCCCRRHHAALAWRLQLARYSSAYTPWHRRCLHAVSDAAMCCRQQCRHISKQG